MFMSIFFVESVKRSYKDALSGKSTQQAREGEENYRTVIEKSKWKVVSRILLYEDSIKANCNNVGVRVRTGWNYLGIRLNS